MTKTRRIAGPAFTRSAARSAGLTIAMLSVVLIDACRHAAPPPPAPAPVPVPAGPNADSARRAQEDAARRAADADAARRRADSIAAADAAARNAASAAATVRATLTQTVHFDLDKADL